MNAPPLIRPVFFAIAAFASLFAALETHAKTFHEQGDAPAGPSAAPVLPPGITRIAGTLRPGTDGPDGPNPVDVDLYVFSVTDYPEPHRKFEIRVPSTPDLPTPHLFLLVKVGETFRYFTSSAGSFTPADAVIGPLTLQGTFCLAVGQRPISAFTADGQTIDSHLNTASPVAYVGTADGDPEPTTGQPYEILFDFKTLVTGLDLVVGARFGRDRVIGLGTLNRSGRRQTISTSGGRRASYIVGVWNYGGGGETSMRVSTPRSLKIRDARSLGTDENVTAAILAGTYRADREDGNGGSYRISVVASGVQRARPSRRIRGKVLTTIQHVKRPELTDTVGAVVNLRAARPRPPVLLPPRAVASARS